MLGILLLPLRIVAGLIRLLIGLVLIPLKIAVAGILFNLGLLLVFVAVLAVVGYFVYQWVT